MSCRLCLHACHFAGGALRTSPPPPPPLGPWPHLPFAPLLPPHWLRLTTGAAQVVSRRLRRSLRCCTYRPLPAPFDPHRCAGGAAPAAPLAQLERAGRGGVWQAHVGQGGPDVCVHAQGVSVFVGIGKHTAVKGGQDAWAHAQGVQPRALRSAPAAPRTHTRVLLRAAQPHTSPRLAAGPCPRRLPCGAPRASHAQAGGSLPLYGVCMYSEEVLHRPPVLARERYPTCKAPYRQCLIAAPRCYCLLSHYPFFPLHFQVRRAGGGACSAPAQCARVLERHRCMLHATTADF